MNTPTNTFGEMLYILMKAKNITIDKLSHKMHMKSKTTIARILKDQSSFKNIQTFYKIYCWRILLILLSMRNNSLPKLLILIKSEKKIIWQTEKWCILSKVKKTSPVYYALTFSVIFRFSNVIIVLKTNGNDKYFTDIISFKNETEFAFLYNQEGIDIYNFQFNSKEE